MVASTLTAEAHDDEQLDKKWGVLTGERPGDLPIAIRSVQITARITAQHGVFTLFGTERDGLERFRDADALLNSIKIEPSAVPDIREELRQAGISERSVYPDLSGLCTSLKAWWLLRLNAKATR